jgi:hypothetical protein
MVIEIHLDHPWFWFIVFLVRNYVNCCFSMAIYFSPLAMDYNSCRVMSSPWSPMPHSISDSFWFAYFSLFGDSRKDGPPHPFILGINVITS